MGAREYCVYRHTAPNGKVYIGITCQKPEKRWQNGRGYLNSHNKHFYNAIVRYGWDNFGHEILFTGLDKDEAEAQERRLIAEYRSADPAFGYNQDLGGCHQGRATAATRKKQSEAKLGNRNPMYGKHIFYGTPCDVSGQNHPMFGRRGKDNPRYGTHHGPESIEKMRANAALSRPVQCVETGAIYRSAEEAGRAIGLSGNGIAGCCRNKPHYNTAGGYHWRYADAS